MSSVSSITSPLTSIYARIAATQNSPTTAAGAAALTDTKAAPASESFSKVFDQLVSSVEDKQAAANEVTRQVLLGESSQLHQSVIAMQEASVALSLMVETRNKVVESYQELMRMNV